jgi:prepilin peptidase CpaA
MTMHPAVELLWLGVALTAAVTDVRGRRIPNWLTLPAIVAGVALNGALGGWHGVLASLEGLGLAFAVYLGLFLLRAVGAGDLKLMAALGAVLTPGTWFGVFVCTALCGGVLAGVMVLRTRRVAETAMNMAAIVKEGASLRLPHERHAELDAAHPRALTLPHALSVLGGSVVWLLVSLMSAAH